MKTESLDKSIDVLIDTIMKSTIRAVDENRIEAVSYTHLTLPTIVRV